MKKILIYTLMLISSFVTKGQGISISAIPSIADSSAILDVKSSTKGVLLPRMSSEDRLKINNPANGLLVYDTNLKSFVFFDGSNWQVSGNNSPAKDSGYLVIYTNTGMTDSINAFINDNYVGTVSPGVFGLNGIPNYKQAKTLSIKWPVGNYLIKGSTSKSVNRTTSATITKGDTVKVKLDYTFQDTNADNYFIEFLENGVLKRYTSNIKKWTFYYYNYQEMITNNGCTVPNNKRHYDGPSWISPNISSPPSDAILKFERISWKSLPIIGNYYISNEDTYDSISNINNGNCQIIVYGAEMACFSGVQNNNWDGSGASITIDNVQVIEDLGLEKRGYYTGSFFAILYYYGSFGALPQLRAITNGRFFAPLGGISFSQ